MEGLRGVQRIYNASAGTGEIELDFLDPPAAVIDALEYAMLNDLTFAIPGGVVSGSLSPTLMKILNIDIQSKTSDDDVYGSISRAYMTHRRVIVHARPA